MSTNHRSCMLVVLWHARHHKADVSIPIFSSACSLRLVYTCECS